MSLFKAFIVLLLAANVQSYLHSWSTHLKSRQDVLRLEEEGVQVALASRDPLYPVYSVFNPNTNQAGQYRLIKIQYFKVGWLPEGTFWHTSLIVANPSELRVRDGSQLGVDASETQDDTSAVLPYSSSDIIVHGAEGFDVGKGYKPEKGQKQYLRREVNNFPKSDAQVGGQRVYFYDACYTLKTVEEIEGHMLQTTRGRYHAFRNNCLYLTENLLRFTCGDSAAEEFKRKFHLRWMRRVGKLLPFLHFRGNWQSIPNSKSYQWPYKKRSAILDESQKISSI
ncbi:hypothetical protein MP228_008477 [Amoeboaphelidium protococcarum]|nr:hypothetical protein MP228_008477 [Amoeboaphelidium protococcarum]